METEEAQPRSLLAERPLLNLGDAELMLGQLLDAHPLSASYESQSPHLLAGYRDLKHVSLT